MTDVVDLLIKVANLKPGDMFPEEFGANWGPSVAMMCQMAADEIKQSRLTIARLRAVAGAVSLEMPASINNPLTPEDMT